MKLGTRSGNLSPGALRLLFVGFSVLTAVALTYRYVSTSGSIDAYFATVGGGVFLALFVTVAAFLVRRSRD